MANQPDEAKPPLNATSTASTASTDVDDQTEDGSFASGAWVLRFVVLFWIGYVVVHVSLGVWTRISSLLMLILIAMFLALAIEPGVNRLARRGWKRGTATATLMLVVFLLVVGFLAAMGTLVGTQLAGLLRNSETYITDTVNTINGWFGTSIDVQEAIDAFNKPDGPVQRFIRSQQDEVVNLSVQALDGLLKGLTVLLFTFYLVADGPRLRRALCSRLPPKRQVRVLGVWELAIDKTGGYLYSRALLAVISTLFHWIAFQMIGIEAPIALALWVGLISQFLPVLGTYLAGILPVTIAFLDSPAKAIAVIVVMLVYQQLENYLLAPRVTARTLQLHPAIAFGAAIAGYALLGAAGAILALPAAAMLQAMSSDWGKRYEVISNDLTNLPPSDTPT